MQVVCFMNRQIKGDGLCARMDAPELIVHCDALRTIDKARGNSTRLENNLITMY